jgi:hypothetical protein
MQDSDAGRLLHLCGELDPFVGWVRSAREETVRNPVGGDPPPTISGTSNI